MIKKIATTVICLVVLGFAYFGWRIYSYRTANFSKYDTGQLIVAIEEGNYSKIEVLINKGVSVNTQRWDGDLTTPLMTACRMNDERSVEILLRAGADPMLRDHDGYDAFMWAKQVGNERIVEMLKKKQKGGL
ncbi:MAG: ankyrin repeat domain-containing protein [Candidatus Omnitrophota bacterium]|jgi:ankyrin repeat protein